MFSPAIALAIAAAAGPGAYAPIQLTAVPVKLNVAVDAAT